MDRSVAAWRALGACALAVVVLAAFRHDDEQRRRIRELEHARAVPVAAPSIDPRELEAIAQRAAELTAARMPPAPAGPVVAATGQPAPSAAPSVAEPDVLVDREGAAAKRADAERAAAAAARAMSDVRARRRIDRSDVLALREALRGADPKVVEQTRNDIAAAVNRGELAVGDPQFLYP